MEKLRRNKSVWVYCADCGKIEPWRVCTFGLFDIAINDAVDLKFRCQECYTKRREEIIQKHEKELEDTVEELKVPDNRLDF